MKFSNKCKEEWHQLRLICWPHVSNTCPFVILSLTLAFGALHYSEPNSLPWFLSLSQEDIFDELWFMFGSRHMRA
jgi:hypothetical protein